MDNLWQSPFVNVFKYFNLPSWKKATREGDVSSYMDKAVKSTVYKINGCVPAGNYILLPKTNSQSLGLSGRYFYLLFKPTPSKHFVVHLDVATTDNLIIRISFSNLFKSFKSTSTWLQFPFVCCPTPGYTPSYAADALRDQSGPAPMVTRWTILCLDLQHTLSMYLNRRFHYIKSLRLCANMTVKNVFTSDNLYDPGLTMSDAKREGLMSHGICPLPRDMSYPVSKGDQWHDSYDWIRFPSDSAKKPFDSIQGCSPKSKLGKAAGASRGDDCAVPPRRIQPRTVDVSKCVSDRVSMINKITAPKQGPKHDNVTKELPQMSTDYSTNHTDEVHVYAHPDERSKSGVKNRPVSGREKQIKKPNKEMFSEEVSRSYKSLEPDPVMKLKKIVGFGGATYQDALWSSDGSSIVYPCHAVVVALKVATGQQRFFIGHTDKVSCLSLTSNGSLLASGQTGKMSTVRVWKFSSGECLTIGKVHVHSLACVSFSSKGTVLCGVGKDGQGKNMVVIWNTTRVAKHREMSLVAKAHTDVDISRIVIAPFDDNKMASCGQDNIRIWRIKEGSLRSAPVALGEYSSMEFTDVCFEPAAQSDSEPESRLFYACSKSGFIFEVDYSKLNLRHVRRLLPIKSKSGKGTKLKDAEDSGGSISINSMHLNETFCVTGSDDGYLRLWPLDFAYVYLEAAHEGPVTASRLSGDGLKILAGTSTGNLGILDVPSRQYSTLMRSHTGRISCFSVDPQHQHLASVSEDHTIRVWDLNSLQQLYDFSAADECPCCVTYHPKKQILACGFLSGAVRVISVEGTCLLAEHRHLHGQVTGLAYSPDGSKLYSCCSLGIAAVYDATTPNYNSLRVIAGLVARGDKFSPQALVVSPCGRRVAFVGPTDFTVTIADAMGLDELVRIDVSGLSANNVDSALRVAFSPTKTGHLLVATANNRLMKYEAKNGKLVYEGTHIHRSGCSAMSVSSCGQFLATGGDKTIKIWDYGMNLDINFQVFIGHSENVSKIHFSPDGMGLISTGEAIYLWDMLVKRAPTPSIEGRMLLEDLEEATARVEMLEISRGTEEMVPYKQIFPRSNKSVSPRSEDLDAFSSIHDGSDGEEAFVPSKKKSERQAPIDIPRSGKDESERLPSKENLSTFADPHSILVIDNGSEAANNNHLGGGDIPNSRNIVVNNGHNNHVNDRKRRAQITRNHNAPPGEFHEPAVFAHYKQREKIHSLAKRRYTAPPNQAGLNLKSVIGYNCNGRNNVVWYPDTGFFAYAAGCVVVIEDLNSGEQKYLQGHTEEVSCLALQNDCQVLVSTSPAFQQDSPCHICVWDTQTNVCRRVLSRHRYSVQCLAFSRDDRFLVSAGDYRECIIVVWETKNFQQVAISSALEAPVHCLMWDPFTVNGFVTAGDTGTLFFWLLEESGQGIIDTRSGGEAYSYSLSVQKAELPWELDGTERHPAPAFTSLAYCGESILFAGTETGKVSVWDTRRNSCFMHWEADTSEITKLVSRHSRLMTAGHTSHALRLWAVGGISDLKDDDSYNDGNRGKRHNSNHHTKHSGLTMEDEMTLDGAVTCAQFDDMLDMGIVGTDAGTLWYINWAERTSIRLVSGHRNKINGVLFTEKNLLLSGGDDGSVRVWSTKNREQALQFQVLEQSCTCLACGPATSPSTTSGRRQYGDAESQCSLPLVVGGYSDGTVRLFDVTKVEMLLKMHPHAVTVTAIAFSADGSMIMSGGSDGLVAVSSPTTGMTVRVISDHKGVAISAMDAILAKDIDVGVKAPTLWLSCSMDRRISVWAADWSKDFCELVDWLTFPAPAVMPDGSRIKKNDTSHFYQLPPTLAKFSPEDVDTIVYCGYGMDRVVHFYSITKRRVLRTVSLTHWGLSLDVSPDSSLISVGIGERLIKLLDYHEGSFQDFTGHSGAVSLTRFSPSGSSLLTVSHNEMFIWELML